MTTEAEGRPAAPRRRAGQMERQVRKDLRGMGSLDTGVRGSLAQAALILARAIDAYSDQMGAAAQLSAIAKAIQELRTTLAALMEKTDDEHPDAPAGDSTPVWDAAEPGAADAGAAGGAGGAAAG